MTKNNDVYHMIPNGILNSWGILHPDNVHVYTCQLFPRYEREIFILGVLGFLKTTQSFPKIPEEVRRLPKTSEVCRRRSYRDPVLGSV